jgi:hypothetical protein
MKKSVILAGVVLTLSVAFMMLTEGAKEIKGVLTVIVISLVVGITFYSMPKQEGTMKKAITLIVMGFAVGLPGWLVAAFVHSKAGAVLFVIGWLITGIGMGMALWNAPLSTYQQRWGGLGLKIFTIGFGIFALGGLMEWMEYMEISSIITKTGAFVGLAGILVSWLGVIEDHMHK